MNLIELKQEYNKLLARYRKAEQYLDDNTIPLLTREKYIPELQKIIDNLGTMITDIQKYEDITEEQILYGFKEDQNNVKTI